MVLDIKEDHVILCGDCLDALKRIPSNSVNLVFTDPPYNQDIKYIKKYFVDKKSLSDYLQWMKERLREIVRVMKDGGTMYLMNYPELNARLLTFLEDELGLKLRRWIVWHYPTNIGHSNKNWTRSHRSILFLTKGDNYTFNRIEITQHYKNPTVSKIKKRIEEGHLGRASYDVLKPSDILEIFEIQNGLSDVLEINLLKNVRHERKKWHNCQLPPELIEIFIKVSSNKKDIVLDPFAGTFSTLNIAKMHERKSIGIDIAKKYCNYGASILEIKTDKIINV